MLFAQELPNLVPWVPTFFTGGFIVWFAFVYLPSKDKQLKELLEAARQEREKESEARDKTANTFQGAMESLAKQHEADAVRDRTAFENRSERTVDAITKMGLQFEVALGKQTDKLESNLKDLAKDVRSSCNFAGEHMRFQKKEPS